MPYNNEFIEVTWDECTLREWLNSSFLYTAFTADERVQIQEHSISPDNTIHDFVWLLSSIEVNEYFIRDLDKVCYATEYAKSRGAHITRLGDCIWWVRTPSFVSISSTAVCDYITLSYFGSSPPDVDAVRPVIFLKTGDISQS